MSAHAVRLLALLGLVAAASHALAQEQVILQLRWLHQFQFAGYYAALEKGYYAEAGLAVEIRAAGANQPSPLEQVLNGQAHFGIGNSGLVMAFQSGKPVVALAALFQRSPNIWLTLRKDHPRSLQDLAGKRLMMTSGLENAELLAMLASEGIHRDSLDIVPSTFDVSDLIDGRVDAFNAYLSNEPYLLLQRGIPYQVFDPQDYGIDFYSDVLFTRADELARHPERVAAFRAASLRGWAYAMAHPDEIVDLILKRYGQNKSRDHLLFEAAAIRTMMQPDFIEIGHMNPRRWDRISATFVGLGMGPAARPLDGFLYDPVQRRLPEWAGFALAAALLIIALAFTASYYTHRMNQRLRAAQHSLAESEERLRLAMGVANQGWFDVDLLTGKVTVSPEYTRMIGYEPEEFSSDMTNWLAHVHAEDRESVGSAFRKCALDGGSVTMEYRRETKSGDWKWIESVGKVVDWDENRRATRMLGIHTDITRRKQAMQDLALVDFAMNHVTEAAYLADRSGRFRYVNDAACRVIGRSREELLKLSVTDVDAIARTPAQWAESWQDISARKTLTFESRHIDGAGREYPVELNATYFEYLGEAYILGLSRDISERNRLREDLQHEKEFAEGLIDTAQAIILVLDEQGCIVRFNRYFEQLSGYALAEVKGASWMEIFLPDRGKPGFAMCSRRPSREKGASESSMPSSQGTGKSASWNGMTRP